MNPRAGLLRWIEHADSCFVEARLRLIMEGTPWRVHGCVTGRFSAPTGRWMNGRRYQKR